MTHRFRAGFTADSFRARRERVLERLDGGAMVLPAAPVRFRSHDVDYRYRPDSELYYVSGLEEPDALVVLAGHSDDERFVVFVRPRDTAAERWEGSRLGVEGAGEHLGADAVYPIDELGERLPKLLHGARAVHYRLGVDDRSQAAVLEALRWSRRRGTRSGQGPRSVVDPGQVLNELRIRKDPQELECIRRAAAVTVSAFTAAAAAIQPGVGEWEIEALLDGRFRAGGAEGPAFSTIVGSGERACIIHYVDNRNRVGAQDLVLVDAGAEMDFYAGDVTRTFPAAGRFTAPQQAVYDIVASALEAGVSAAVPGGRVTDVHAAAVRVLVEGLRSLGVVKGSVDDVLEKGDHKPFYPHQTSHWLGLDVHEPLDYARDGEARILEPGMVLTVEPGLYFPPSSGDAASGYLGIGVRLEDDVLVGEGGPERLTGDLPVDRDSVAGMVRGGGR